MLCRSGILPCSSSFFPHFGLSINKFRLCKWIHKTHASPFPLLFGQSHISLLFFLLFQVAEGPNMTHLGQNFGAEATRSTHCRWVPQSICLGYFCFFAFSVYFNMLPGVFVVDELDLEKNSFREEGLQGSRVWLFCLCIYACRYFVGVLDKKSYTMRLHDADVFNLKPAACKFQLLIIWEKYLPLKCILIWLPMLTHVDKVPIFKVSHHALHDVILQ